MKFILAFVAVVLANGRGTNGLNHAYCREENDKKRLKKIQTGLETVAASLLTSGTSYCYLSVYGTFYSDDAGDYYGEQQKSTVKVIIDDGDFKTEIYHQVFTKDRNAVDPATQFVCYEGLTFWVDGACRNWGDDACPDDDATRATPAATPAATYSRATPAATPAATYSRATPAATPAATYSRATPAATPAATYSRATPAATPAAGRRNLRPQPPETFVQIGLGFSNGDITIRSDVQCTTHLEQDETQCVASELNCAGLYGDSNDDALPSGRFEMVCKAEDWEMQYWADVPAPPDWDWNNEPDCIQV